MKRKTVIITALIVAVILLGAAVCMLPWPTSFNVQMSGYLYTDDNTAGTPVYVTAQGKTLNYLFAEDKIEMRFITSGIEDWQFLKSTDPDTRLDQLFNVPYIISSCGAYRTTQNDMCSAHYAFSIEDEVMLIYIHDDKNPVIACSTSGLSRAEIEVFFSEFQRMYGHD